MSANTSQIVENADIDRDTPQPEIHVEERSLKLHDYLKTCIKVNGSDVHLQEGSIPMIRVDGRARFLDTPAATEGQMKEFVGQLVADPEKAEILHHKGAIDVAYSMGPGQPRFRTNVFHSREKYAIVMRRIVTK